MTLLLSATLSGRACTRLLVLCNTLHSSLVCALGLLVLNNVGVRPLYFSLVKFCRVGRRVADTTWRRGQSRPAYWLHRLQEKISKLRLLSYALRSRPVRHPRTRRCLHWTSAHSASPTRFTTSLDLQTWTPQRLALHSCSTSNNR